MKKNNSEQRHMAQLLMRIILGALLFASAGMHGVSADEANGTEHAESGNAIEILGEFSKKSEGTSEIVTIPDQKKRLVMFVMGVPLLCFILITAVLGIAMGVYGKPVYVPHMIFAGLSVTLAIAHAIVGIVWFYPF